MTSPQTMTSHTPLMNTRGELTDQAMVDFLRRRPAVCIAELVDFAGVTATAVRQRLSRLMKQGFVHREAEASVGRGRPTYRYSLTEKGVRSAGNNYEQLVPALWEEIRAIGDPQVRRGLLKRLAERMARSYRDQIGGESVQQRMESLARLMSARQVPFEVDASEQLPVLTALACPYPEIAEQDRGVCAMEKMLFSEILGQGVRLSACRLDGDDCCSFEPIGSGAAPERLAAL